MIKRFALPITALLGAVSFCYAQTVTVTASLKTIASGVPSTITGVKFDLLGCPNGIVPRVIGTSLIANPTVTVTP